MPVTINEVDAEVNVQSGERGVEGGGSSDASSKTQPTPESQATWMELARREAQREARTAAWGFDD